MGGSMTLTEEEKQELLLDARDTETASYRRLPALKKCAFHPYAPLFCLFGNVVPCLILFAFVPSLLPRRRVARALRGPTKQFVKNKDLIII
jgi:hypothetical protein